jgi:hypothetical protein
VQDLENQALTYAKREMEPLRCPLGMNNLCFVAVQRGFF